MLACYACMCPSDVPALFCFVLPHTCVWICILFLQLVSDRLAAGHVVLVVCPRCTDVCFCRPCGVYYVPLLPRCVMLVGYGGMCPSDSPALCCFVLPHMHLDPPFLQLVSDRLVAQPAQPATPAAAGHRQTAPGHPWLVVVIFDRPIGPPCTY